MFGAAQYRLLVRRVRSGDCDKIGELYSVVEPDLTAFCQSLTSDSASARRAADEAFTYAAELLAAQSLTVAVFRTTLLAEAKGRCYSEIGRAAQMDSSDESADDPAELDINQLQTRLEQLRPESLDTPSARLTWRSRLAPSTAVSVVLVMVVMIEMAALGLDLIPKSPEDRDSRNAAAESATLQSDHQPVAAQVAGSKKSTSEDAVRRERADDKKTSQVDPSPVPDSRAGDSTSSSQNKQPSDSPASDDPLSQVPVADKLPELPAPEIKVEVEAGPIEVKVTPEAESGILPQATTCVGSTCIQTP